MAVELATAYISIIPSARGIEKNMQRELAPVSAVAAVEGERAGTKLAGGLTTKFASKTGSLFQSLERQLGNFGGPFTGSLTTIGTSLRAVESGQLRVRDGASDLEKVATGAYVGTGLAAAGFGALSIKAALGAEQAQAQLEQALTATGHSWDDWGGKVSGAGEHLAKFGFDQEEVNAALAKLTRASKDPAKALELIGVAADIARAKNLDLGTASQILVNIEAGRVRGLAQLGISTKDAAGNTVDATEAVRRITALYGGAAAANAKTYAGQLRAVGAELHNLEEEVGAKLLPVVADLGKDLLAGVHGFEAVNKATDGWLGTLGGAALIAGGVAVATSKVSSGVAKLGTLFGAQKVATEAATAAEAAQVAVTEADAVAQGELAASSATTAAAMEAEAASAGILSTSLTGVAGPLAALAVGAIGGKKLGDELLSMATKSTPKVDELTAALIRLEKGQEAGLRGSGFAGIASDLDKQINRSGSPLKLPFEFGQSVGSFFTGGGAQRAKADVDNLNAALKSVLQTEGVDKATLAYGRFQQQFIAAGGDGAKLAADMEPFFAALDLASAKEDHAGASSQRLAANFQDLADSFTKDSAVLGIADQLDAATKAVDDLNQVKLDALGQGQKSIDAAQREEQAQQSLSDAYRTQQSAVANLADAKAKLAQFDSPTDRRIRDLELQNIQSRVVQTPEEARQKEIDLLQFSEDTANKRADLQKAIVSAEGQVASATEGVTKAQEAVSTASKARAQIQIDAANGIAAAERKAKEATDAVGTALINADAAGQLGKGNEQLSIYVTLLDGLLKQVDPTNPQIKNLDEFLNKLSLVRTLGGSLGPAPFVGSGGVPPTVFQPPAPPVGPPPAAKPTIDFHPTTTIHASDVPTQSAIDTMNRKQGIKLAALIPA